MLWTDGKEKNGTKSWFLKPHHTISKEGLRSNLETHPRWILGDLQESLKRVSVRDVMLLLLLFSCLVVSHSLWPHGLHSARVLCPWDFPGKNTGVGSHILLQGIFLTQGLNQRFLCLLHRQVDSVLAEQPWNKSRMTCNRNSQRLNKESLGIKSLIEGEEKKKKQP